MKFAEATFVIVKKYNNNKSGIAIAASNKPALGVTHVIGVTPYHEDTLQEVAPYQCPLKPEHCLRLFLCTALVILHNNDATFFCTLQQAVQSP